MKAWLDYWRSVRGRVTWDRSLLRGLWVVPLLWLRGWARRPAQSGSIAYHPSPAGPWYTLPLALSSTGIRTVRDPSRADAVMIFDDQTRSDVSLPDTTGILLNARATDITKARVGMVFEQVFGYRLAVDPCSHVGPMVEKSETNGVHDGRIVNGALGAAAPGFAYQVLVDSTVRPGVTEDLRCVCVGGRVVQVFRKEKASGARFGTTYLETTLRAADDVLRSEEQARIAEFCGAIGLDFGSIDVLRDHAGDGRIYIVDVNKTCMPVLSMPVTALDKALQRIARAAENMILEAHKDR